MGYRYNKIQIKAMPFIAESVNITLGDAVIC